MPSAAGPSSSIGHWCALCRLPPSPGTWQAWSCVGVTLPYWATDALQDSLGNWHVLRCSDCLEGNEKAVIQGEAESDGAEDVASCPKPCEPTGGGAAAARLRGVRRRVSFAAVLDRAENVIPCYAIVRDQLKPQVAEEALPSRTDGFAHSVSWSWNGKELVLEGAGRSKRAARNAAARDLLKKLAAEEQELMDPTRNPALAGWALNWINEKLQASMDLQEAEHEQEELEGQEASAGTRHTCTWSCPQLEGETVVHASASTAAQSRHQAMMDLYRELPPAVEGALEAAVRRAVAGAAAAAPAAPAGPGLDEGACGQINSMHNTLTQRLGIRFKHEFAKLRNAEFQCTVRWDFHDPVELRRRTVEARGTGRSKVLARARANEQVLVQEGHLPQLDDGFRRSVAELRRFLDASRVEDAVAAAKRLMEAPTPGPASWIFFLPEVVRAILAERDERVTSGLFDTVGEQLRLQGGAPLQLWEALLDEASFSLRHFWRASALLEQLVAFPLAEGTFPTEEEAAYFKRFRHLLALERHGGLLHGIQQYELDPQTFCSVPTVDVHHFEADKVVLTTAPGAAALDLLEGPRPLRGGDLVLLVPIEVVPEVRRQDPTLADGERLPSNWEHPQAWLASVLSTKGNPRSGEDLRLWTRRISRFGSEAEEAPGAEEAVAPIALGRQYRLFSIAMETPLARMLSSLRCLCRARLPAWSDDYEGRKPSYQYTPELRHLLVAGRDEARELAVEAVRQPAGTAPASEAVEFLARQAPWCAALTPSQRQALGRALEQRLSLIQGPPGTGKTYVACAIIAAWADRYGSLGERILAVADSNVAADNLHARLQAFGVKSVRVGHGKEVETLTGEQLWAAVRHARIVIATCIGSGMEVLDTKGMADCFQRVVIDECTQACEPAALVALGRGCEQAVLIGDHRQLPATVLSRLAQRDGLGVSLFERMAESGVEPTVLQEQRRMHSSIAEFPNREFYASQLVNAVDDSTLPVVPGFPWPNPDCRVCFVDVSSVGEAGEGRRGFSAFNASEAEAVAAVVRELLEAGVGPQELCVLTAYVAQRLELLRALQDAGLRHQLPQLSVDTVDGYQGMERDLVLFSATRSNASRTLGFLSDARRMNVMLTRARRGLIVFGNGDTLRHGNGGDSRWQSWLAWVENKGAVLPLASLIELRSASRGVRDEASRPAAAAAAERAAPGPAAGGADAGAGATASAPAGVEPASAGHAAAAGAAASEPRGAAGGGLWEPPPPPAPAPKQPQSQWQKVYSEQYGRHYYWDKATNTTQWEVPAGLAA